MISANFTIFLLCLQSSLFLFSVFSQQPGLRELLAVQGHQLFCGHVGPMSAADKFEMMEGSTVEMNSVQVG
jgi:hypothetical protein